MATGTRARNRAEMQSRIRRLGRTHLKVHGAAGLSLRAIARDMGVVSSAVYRYVPSRDELLTMLLVEGFDDLGDAVADALTRAGADDHRARLLVLARTVREWAVADPARWALLYGSPVPGYDAPAEVTTGPGTRVIADVLTELAAARAAGTLREDLPEPGSAALRADLRRISDQFAPGLAPRELLAATTFWSAMIGAVAAEVFGQLGADTFTDPESLFYAQVRAILGVIFT